jgi:hypothetical protein
MLALTFALKFQNSPPYFGSILVYFPNVVRDVRIEKSIDSQIGNNFFCILKIDKKLKMKNFKFK